MHQGNALDALHRTSQSAGRDTENYFVPPIVLKVEGLVKIYGKRRVVDGVSFHVNKGEIVGLLGPNGAGKTTSFRMTCGLISSNGGVVYLGPHDVTNWPMYRRSREGGMGYLPQDKSVFQKLSVQNNLLGVMEMIGIKRSERKRRCDELLEKFRLTHLRRNLGGGLSGGERRRLEIARALVSEPNIILLDEPFAAVDPITVTGIQEIIRHLADEGISILITDHSVQDTLQITHRSYVIQSGQVLCHGTPAEVLGNPEARKVYFGENVSVGQLQQSGIILPLTPPVVEEPPKPEKPPKRVLGQKHRPAKRTTDLSTAVETPSGRHDLKRTALHPAPEQGEPTKEATSSHPSAVALHSQTRMTAKNGAATRTTARRLVPSTASSISERPLVHSTTPKPTPESAPTTRPTETTGSDEPAPGASGVIRTLGAMIWGK